MEIFSKVELCSKCEIRRGEADQERALATNLAPKIALESLFRGLDHLQRQNADAAIRDFDQALTSEPDHFLARFFQAACFLQLKKPTEAKVALTACMGQRPRFVWSHLLRGQAYLQLGELVAAAQDFQIASEMRPNESAQVNLDEAMAALGKAIAALPRERQEIFWGEKIITGNGRQPLREVAILQKVKKG